MTRELPKNLEAEKATLGSLLIDKDISHLVFPILRPGDFYDPRNRIVYQAMLDLESEGKPCDYVTVASRLSEVGKLAEIGNSAYINELMQSTPSSLHVEYYAESVKNYAKLRSLLVTAQRVVDSAYAANTDSVTSVLDKSADLLYNVFKENDNQQISTAEEMMKEYWIDLEKRLANPTIAEVSTGFPELDTVINGYVPSDLIIVAGRPSWGKTSWVMASLLKLGQANIPSVLFAYEMSRLQTSQRFVSMISRVPLLKVKSGVGLSEKEAKSLTDAVTKVSKYPIYIDANAFGDIYYLTSAIRAYVARYGVKVVFIDYLQIIPTHTDDLTNEYGRITRTLKILARTLGITIVLVSQLNRAVETRGGKPILADLRQSGRIEEDTDIVLFIYRDKDKDSFDREIIVAKNRNGPAGGTLKVLFEDEIVLFTGREV